MKTEFKITAVWDGNRYYHFGIRAATASLYGDDPADIKTLTMVISEDQSEPTSVGKDLPTFDYWGWYENEDDEISMLYPQKFLLNMCFVYGMEIEEEAGKGKAYRLEIKEN